jgi:hypothetical protein
MLAVAGVLTPIVKVVAQAVQAAAAPASSVLNSGFGPVEVAVLLATFTPKMDLLDYGPAVMAGVAFPWVKPDRAAAEPVEISRPAHRRAAVAARVLRPVGGRTAVALLAALRSVTRVVVAVAGSGVVGPAQMEPTAEVVAAPMSLATTEAKILL